jgi:hypothetical protein
VCIYIYIYIYIYIEKGYDKKKAAEAKARKAAKEV